MQFDCPYSSRRPLPSSLQTRGRAAYPGSTYLKVDGLAVKYIGEGREDSQAASVRADHPVPRDLPLFYYEMKVVNGGQKGFIGIGFCREDSALGKLPGWEAHTYGYHGDDGHAFNGPGRSQPYGPNFTAGDVVGALLDNVHQTISFHKNGQPLGVAFSSVSEPTLYPMVGLRSPDEEVVVNFGSSSFAVDVPQLIRSTKERLLSRVLAMKLPLTTGDAAAAAGGSAVGKAAPVDGKGSTAAAGAAAAAGPGPSSSAAAAAEAASRGGMWPGSLSRASLIPMASPAAVIAPLRGADNKSSSRAGGDASPAAEQDPAAAALLQQLLQPSREHGSSSQNGASQPLLPSLLFEYLLHHCCWQTAELVARDMLIEEGRCSSRRGVQHIAGEGTTAVTMEEMAAQQGYLAEADGDVQMADGEACCQPGTYQAAAADGVADTAAAAAAPSTNGSSSGILTTEQIQDAVLRQQLQQLVLQGQLEEVGQLVEQHYGSTFWTSRPQLLFKLRLQQFVELLRSQGTSDVAVLQYGRKELAPLASSPSQEEALAEVLSLLAYSEPSTSPAGYLMQPSHRHHLAQDLNGALLASKGCADVPVLQQLYCQVVVVMDELQKQQNSAAACLNLQKLLSGGEER